MTVEKDRKFGTVNTPRFGDRQSALSAAFSVEKMADVWKEYVKPGLRDQQVLDLFDYNDFHWNRDRRFYDLNRLILSGRYTPSRSIMVRLEKGLGICRTIITPSPEDAVVLQCLVESMIKNVLKKQPSHNSFFSRSHKLTIGTFDFSRDYIWFAQWKRFSSRRVSVISKHDWVVTTDISTFFDNIRHSHLRNILSSLNETDEVILDLLFSIINTISWRPDYLPISDVGIPQVQFDAPRLLSHAYLFEIDNFLKEKTNNSFVRWVDDITFAVDSKNEGMQILRDLDLLLQSRGVRLNSGKTKVLSAFQASEYFFTNENRKLNSIKASIVKAKNDKAQLRSLCVELQNMFDIFIKTNQNGNYVKVLSRYIGLFTDLRSKYVIDFALDSISDQPSLRDAIYRYLEKTGASIKIIKRLFAYLLSGSCLDDASRVQISILITRFHIARESAQFSHISSNLDRISSPNFIGDNDFKFISALWLICKYSTRSYLRDFLRKNQILWQSNEFLSRQVAASLSRFSESNDFSYFSEIVFSHGFRSSVSVVEEIRRIRSIEGDIDQGLRLYIANGNQTSIYSIQRFLIAINIFRNNRISSRNKKAIFEQIMNILRDPLYRQAVEHAYSEF